MGKGMSFMTDYATGLAVIPVCMTVLWMFSGGLVLPSLPQPVDGGRYLHLC